MLNDEVVLNTDGFLRFDPAKSLRQRAQAFLASRQWSTPEVTYGDQPEPELGEPPLWSFSFAFGLDHVRKYKGDWFADVEALLAFVQDVVREAKSEVVVQVSYRSKPWYSEHIV